MHTLIAGGDSFIFGSELQDCEWPEVPSNSTYPAKLAIKHAINYECVAVPGYSNSAIARTIINKCMTTPDAIVLVSWTYPNRYELATELPMTSPVYGNATPWYSFNHNNLAKDKQRQPVFVEMIEDYLKYVGHYAYYQYYNTLRDIVYLQNFLKINGIPYVFTSADDSICFQRHQEIVKFDDASNTLSNLLEQVDWDNWFLFPMHDINWLETTTPNGFWKWAMENNFKCGVNLHPLEDAHAAAAVLLSDKFARIV